MFVINAMTCGLCRLSAVAFTVDLGGYLAASYSYGHPQVSPGTRLPAHSNKNTLFDNKLDRTYVVSPPMNRCTKNKYRRDCYSFKY